MLVIHIKLHRVPVASSWHSLATGGGMRATGTLGATYV